MPGPGDWRSTVPAGAVSEPSSTTSVSKLPSSRATASSTATPRTSGTDARGGPLETTMPIGPGRRRLVAARRRRSRSRGPRASPTTPRLRDADREAGAAQRRRRLAPATLPRRSGTAASAVPRLTRSDDVEIRRARPGSAAPATARSRAPRATDSEYARLPTSSGASGRVDVGRLGERRARLRHGHARHLRHLDDAVGVRDRRADERERGRGGDPDRDERHPAAAAALPGRVAPRRLERRRRRAARRRPPSAARPPRSCRRPPTCDRRRGGAEPLERPRRRVGRSAGIAARAARRRAPTASGGASGTHESSDGAASCARRSPTASRSSPSNGVRPDSSQKSRQPSAYMSVAVSLSRAARLLGRPVLGRPEQHSLGRDARRRAGDPREAEVGDDDAAGRALDQDVAGREVAMDDPAGMRVGERRRDRQRDLGRLRPSRSTRLRATSARFAPSTSSITRNGVSPSSP